ncbi:hypothetical protein [Poritiphilus flavus]|uniref:Uncharacterized protein n=1 Tax=Poritiphilus flavus TaxID=2697053 RepID=A0A6L9E6T4_9FLAO|nr:hypothetical protein [Poritiphilus flavus]NAS10457.1 hypothetical protein [Poritiphilus flavus]
MRNFLILGCCLLLLSCNWFASPETRTRKLVEAELLSIDWNDVDQYPLFDDCDETAPKSAQKECFENTLLLHFSMTLQDFEFTLDQDIDDTIYMDFLVDREGSMSVLYIEENQLVNDQIPEFNGIISQSLKSLPRVEPALKRGNPVNAKFRIPIVLNTK